MREAQNTFSIEVRDQMERFGFSQIGATLSGGPKRYAPIYLRTDAGEVLLEDLANGFYLGMRLSIDE